MILQDTLPTTEVSSAWNLLAPRPSLHNSTYTVDLNMLASPVNLLNQFPDDSAWLTLSPPRSYSDLSDELDLASEIALAKFLSGLPTSRNLNQEFGNSELPNDLGNVSEVALGATVQTQCLSCTFQNDSSLSACELCGAHLLLLELVFELQLPATSPPWDDTDINQCRQVHASSMKVVRSSTENDWQFEKWIEDSSKWLVSDWGLDWGSMLEVRD